MTRLTLGPDEVGLQRVAYAAARVCTPFYLYEIEVVKARAAALRAVLPGGNLYYSAKANPHPGVVAAAAAAGCGVELASLGELGAAENAAVESGRTMLVGPAKTPELLAAAIKYGVGVVVVESDRELQRLVHLVATTGQPIGVMLRLSLPGARGGLRMSGHQFGMDRAEVLACHQRLAASNGATFLGYHGYLASQLLDLDDIEHNALLVLDAVADLAGAGHPARHVDLGGGFGVSYTDGDRPLDLEALGGVLRRLESAAAGTRLVFESGRFVAGPAGALVCRVVDVKDIDGRRFVLLDGGMNSSGLFGGGNGMRGLRHSVVRDGAVRAGGVPANICGPLCTPMDRLATAVPCAAEVDDLVVWWNMGAYGFTAAPLNFLSFAHPDEVIV